MNFIFDIPYKVARSAIEGQAPEGLYNAVVEISSGDNIKYEVHPNGYYLTAVRSLSPIFRYPFSYGFIPQTLAEDGDALDVIIITPEPLARLSVVEIRLLGYIETIDKGFVDTKIIAVPAYSRLKKVSVEKVMAFLKNYKYPENDTTEVKEYVADVEEAKSLIESAHKAFDGRCLPFLGEVNTYVQDEPNACCHECISDMKIEETPQVEEKLEPTVQLEPIVAPEAPLQGFPDNGYEDVQNTRSTEPEPSLGDIPIMGEPIYDSEVSSVSPDIMDSNNQSIEKGIPQVAVEERGVQEEIVSQSALETAEENKEAKIQGNSGWLT